MYTITQIMVVCADESVPSNSKMLCRASALAQHHLDKNVFSPVKERRIAYLEVRNKFILALIHIYLMLGSTPHVVVHNNKRKVACVALVLRHVNGRLPGLFSRLKRYKFGDQLG